MAMTDVYIEKFGTKLFAASKSVNKIPTEYLKQAFNARIFDWGIGPRKWKELLTNSTLWTNNKGGFVLNNTLYQITNSKIYAIDLNDWTQDEIADLWYDTRTDVLVYGDNFAIITSEWQPMKVFDWTATLITPWTVPTWDTGGIIEFINANEWYTLYAVNNILYISRPITPANPEYAYDYTWSGAQNITYKAKIVSLKVSLSWVFIFTEDWRVEFIGSDALQDIAWSPTFLSKSIGKWWVPVNNRSVAASWDQIFYLTKNRIWNSINYLSWTDQTVVGKLSSIPVVGIDELLKTIDIEQPNAESFYNENDNTIQVHVRTQNSQFNNVTLIYDLINQTFSIDTGKKYNYIVPFSSDYYGFSDLNSNIYKDDTWFSDAGEAIPFKIRTQDMNYGSIRQKYFGGIITAWAIGAQSELTYRVFIDKESVFRESITWNRLWISGIWEIWGTSIWEQPIAWPTQYISELTPFERLGDEWRIYEAWTRAEIEISSVSQIQDFIIDMLGLRVEQTMNVDIGSKF